MDRRERGTDLNTAMLAAFQGQQAGMWTAMPGNIISFDASKRTVSVQPTLKAKVQDETGAYTWVQLPVLVDCPVFFPSGGGGTLTFPIKTGDECLVVFGSRCIDSWWQLGGIQNQADLRMHDLSDGFAFVGVSSVPKVIPSISTTRPQFRSDDGAAYVEIDPTSHLIRAHTSGNIVAECVDATVTASGNIAATAGGSAHLTAASEITLAAPIVNIVAPVINLQGTLVQTAGAGVGTSTMQGPLTVQNTIKSNTEVIAITTPLHVHQHTGVTTGGGNTGNPTP